jgi:putative endonuclease
MDRPGYVYIMASARNGTIYIGSTNDLPRRAWQHRNAIGDGFTKRHRCHLLVWFEAHDSIDGARLRELQMKKWKRLWKLCAIERDNPDWADLYATLL